MSFGIWELVIVLAIVALLFGTRKLRTIGSDLGGALKGFRNAMKDDEGESAKGQSEAQSAGAALDGEVVDAGEKDKPPA